jgi:hypothetical protein
MGLPLYCSGNTKGSICGGGGGERCELASSTYVFLSYRYLSTGLNRPVAYALAEPVLGGLAESVAGRKRGPSDVLARILSSSLLTAVFVRPVTLRRIRLPAAS